MSGKGNVYTYTVARRAPHPVFAEQVPEFRNLPEDTTEENIQARCRGIVLMAISNKTGHMLLSTGNKSEMSVGYATLYGDMAGGFAPIKDVPKTMVYRLAEYRNRGGEMIPRRVIERPPSAELKADQKDSDSLPEYEVLDAILLRYIEQDQCVERIIQDGYDPQVVRRVASMVDNNEYKRRQAPPGEIGQLAVAALEGRRVLLDILQELVAGQDVEVVRILLG